MNTLLQVQILLCRDNDGIVAGSANDRAGGEEVDQGHGNPHTHPQQCHTVQGHPTHYFLVDIFMFIFFIFFNEAYLLTLSSSALTTVKSTALWCFNGTSPPSSSLQQSATQRWKVLLLYWVIILLLFLVRWPTSPRLSIWRPNRQTKQSHVALYAVLPSSLPAT